ncbi:MAG: DDE-type integrase/transposase/recombinase [Pirellulales bacterium]
MWSYDFIEDRTEKNRKLRMLMVIDEFTRESLAIDVAWSFKSQQVAEVLQYLFAVRGAPAHLRSDNGPEFVARHVTRWLEQAGVETLFIAKGSPWENGYVQGFNSRFRDELLDCALFVGLEDAR